MNCVRFNHSGEIIVSGSSDRKLFIYEGKDCKEIGEIHSAQPHERSVTAVSWMDEKVFATSSNDTTVKVWKAEAGVEALLKTLRVGEAPHEIQEMQVGVVAVAGDIYSLSLHGALNHWKEVSSLSDGSLPSNRYHGHNAPVSALAHRTDILYSGDYSGKIG